MLSNQKGNPAEKANATFINKCTDSGMSHSDIFIKPQWLLMPSLLLLLGCSWFSTVKRYRRIDQTVLLKDVTEDSVHLDESNMMVTMKLSNTKIDPAEPKPSFKSLWDLQGQGQRELIQTLDKRFRDTDNYIGNLGNKYLDASKDDKDVPDLTKKKVKLVFTISRWHPYEFLDGRNESFSLADRVEYINYTLTLNDKNLHFINWDKYTTQYGSVNIADVSFQHTLSANAGYGDTSSGLNALVSGSASRTENQHIQYRYIQLNGSLSRNSIQMESEGTREVDLSGNVVVECTMQFDPLMQYIFTLEKAVTDEGVFKTPDKVKMSSSRTIIVHMTRGSILSAEHFHMSMLTGTLKKAPRLFLNGTTESNTLKVKSLKW